MDIAKVFKDAVEVSRKNHALFIPPMAVMLIMLVLTLVLLGGGMLSMRGGMSSPDDMASSFGSLMGGAFLVSIIGGLIGLFAHGMTVAMAQEALDTGKTTINTGIAVAKGRLVPLLTAAILFGVAVMIGAMLFVIPGIVAAFFLMFTFVMVVTGNIGAVDAMKGSVQLVKSHLGDAAVLFVALFVAGLAAGMVNMVLNVVPIIGQILGMALMGIFSGYISVVMVIAYRMLKGTAA